MKYIILKSEYEIVHPIIFDDSIEHQDMRIKFPSSWELIGAGMCKIGESNKFITYGKSVSLMKFANKEDERYLNSYMSFNL